MGADPIQGFFDNQRRCQAHRDFDGFKAEHDIQPATDEVDMGWRIVSFAQLNTVCISKSILSRHEAQAIAKMAISQYWQAAETESRCDAPFRD